MKKAQVKTDFTTNLTANEYNENVGELTNIADFTQISPTGIYNTGGDNQYDQVIKFYTQTNRFFEATGSSNAITLSTPTPRNSQKAYYNYMEVVFIAPLSNSGNCTINIDGLGTKNLKNLAGADLVAGNIVAGDLITAFYNGTDFLTKITPRPTSITKFAVNDASVDAITGQLNFITSPAAKQVQVNGSVVPIQGTYYDGSGFIISNQQDFNTNGFADETENVVIAEEGIILPSVARSKITESHLPPTGGVDGNYWIQTNPLKTYKKIAGVWTLTRWCQLGEYPTTAAGIVGTIKNYNFNRIQIHTQSVSTASGIININNTIGTSSKITKCTFDNITGSAGGGGITNGSSGYELSYGQGNSSIGYSSGLTLTRNTISLRCGANGLWHGEQINCYFTGATVTIQIEGTY